MKRFRDVTIAEALKALGQYRALLGAVGIIALLLIGLPAPKTTEVSAGGNARRSASGNNTQAAASTATGTGGAANAGNGPAGGGPGQSVIGSGTAPEGAWGWQALGSAQAQSAPDCDPATGYLNMPTKVFNFPCVPVWPAGADNGGATATGVTETDITVIVYKPQLDPAVQAAEIAAGVSDTQQQLEATLAGIQKLFGRHAELYGRKVKIVRIDASGSTAENERADAIQAVEQYHPFAAINLDGICATGDGTGLGFVYEMALRGVEGFCSTTASLDQLRQAEPYLWIAPYQGVMLQEQHLLFTAELICKRLKDHPAKWAGDPLLQSQTRKFGYLYIDSPDTATAQKIFQQALGNCGVSVDSVGLPNDVAQGQEQVPNAIAKFKSNHDNVVILNAGFLNSGVATKQATNQAYQPEWLETGFAYTDATIFVRATYDPTQAAHLYGLREVGLQPAKPIGDGWSLYRWENGENPPAKLLGQDSQMTAWHAFFSAVHLAGPDLTPDSVRDALINLPPYGGSYTGAVSSVGKSFGSRGVWPWEDDSYFDNSAVDDTTFTWWSATAQGQDESGNQGPGMMMFVDGGKRYRLGQLPEGEPDFFGNNGTAEISQLGPNDQPPSYDNKQGCDTRQACYG